MVDISDERIRCFVRRTVGKLGLGKSAIEEATMTHREKI